SEPRGKRQRVVEDIEKSTVVTTAHTIHSHYCPQCKKRVEPVVTDALPKSTIGNRALVLSSWLHYGLGQTISQIVSVFDSLFHFPVSPGGLAQKWQSLGAIIEPWYDDLAQEARNGAVLNADETGWRVNGKTHWLWCFTNPALTYYVIDPTRSSKVPVRFLADCFNGTLVSDFFGAYNAIGTERQMCLVHLLRELEKVDKTSPSKEWTTFRRILKRILKDAIRLSRRTDREAPDYKSRVARIHKRLDKLTSCDTWTKPDCKRLRKRLIKFRDSLFTFLDDPAVPFDNNRAEREIRPAVIARKNSFHNTSEKGANTQAMLMSIYRTLKLRGLDPIETIADALAIFIASGKLPNLPPAKPPG
ncbi:IS66 family transposase, partial [bacterium]|nr:IS66 family transposase [bacterium]